MSFPARALGWRLWALVILPLGLVTLAAWLSVQWHFGKTTPRGAVQPLPQPAVWVEDVPSFSFTHADLSRLATRFMEAREPVWRPIALPSHVRLSPQVDLRSAQLKRLWIKASLPVIKHQNADDTTVIQITRLMGGPVSLWVNEELVHANLKDWRTQWNQPLLIPLSRHFRCDQVACVIHMALPYLDQQGYSVGSIQVGTRHALQPLHDGRVLLQNKLPQVSMIVILIMGMLSLKFWWVRRQETEHLLICAASVAWFIVNLQYFMDFEQDPWAAKWFGAIVDAAVAWVMVLLFLFILRFLPSRHALLEACLKAYAVLTWAITCPLWNWQLNALSLQHTLDVAVGAGMCAFLLWRCSRERRRDLWAMTLAMCFMLCVGAYDAFGVTSQVNPDAIHWFPYAALPVFAALTYASQLRHLDAQRRSEALTASLASDLMAHRIAYEKELELLGLTEERNLRERERERLRLNFQNVLSQRMQSLISRFDRQAIDHASLALELKSCLNETRLLMESLEAVGHDVEALLGHARPRIEQQLKRKRAVLHWALGLVPPLEWLSASDCLAILKWLDSAMSAMLDGVNPPELVLSTAETPTGINLSVSAQVLSQGDPSRAVTQSQDWCLAVDAARSSGFVSSCGWGTERAFVLKLDLPKSKSTAFPQPT
jgi:hypothetical protein